MRDTVAAAKDLIAAMDLAGLVSLSFQDQSFSMSASKPGAYAAPPPQINAGQTTLQGTGQEGASLESSPPKTVGNAVLTALASSDQSAGDIENKRDEKSVLVASPMVGTACRSLEPSGWPLVSVGDSVKKGQALCAIEAMKMVNEIPSPVDGKVLEILFEDGALAEYGAPLVLVGEEA